MKGLEPRVAALLRRTRLQTAARVATRLERRALHWKPATNPTGDEATEFRDIVRFRSTRMLSVSEPLVLISQVHRSGGTLLLRLLDGHPQLLVVPHELGAMLPERPVPLDPVKAWTLLHDPKLARRFRRGLRQQERQLSGDNSYAPFLLSPLLHRRLFDQLIDRRAAASGREQLDAYLTAYFNAWLDCQGLRVAEKRWVAGFEPGLLAQPKRLARVRALYPDGRVITILREPAAWYASARLWAPRFAQLDQALAIWRESALAAEALLDDPAVLTLVFDDLVERPVEAMRSVASFLGIDFVDSLLVPTANGVPFGANSSFAGSGVGVVEPRRDRAGLLGEEERRAVARDAGPLYERLRDRVASRRDAA